MKPETGKIYGRYTRRIFTKMNLTPDQALEKVKQEASANRWDTYCDLINATAEFTERGRYLATFALRSFLYKNGLMMLPPARTSEPTRVREPTVVGWDEALAICAAASKPYNLVFKLMLHCGWGCQEFMRFNTTEHWEYIKKLESEKVSRSVFIEDTAKLTERIEILEVKAWEEKYGRSGVKLRKPGKRIAHKKKPKPLSKPL